MAKKASKKASKKKAAKKASKKAAKKPASQEMLLVVSKTKETLKGYDVNIAGDALDGLNSWIYWLIDQAAKRCVENGRKTIRPHDFMAQ